MPERNIPTRATYAEHGEPGQFFFWGVREHDIDTTVNTKLVTEVRVSDSGQVLTLISYDGHVVARVDASKPMWLSEHAPSTAYWEARNSQRIRSMSVTIYAMVVWA